jgi:acylpyruvate hydrolase
MRLGRFHAEGQDRIGVFEDGEVRDVTNRFGSFRDTLSRPADAASADGETFNRSEITHLPPITDQNTIFCAGLNYEAHAKESDIAVPEWPLIFLKLPQTLVGHKQPISYHTDVTEEIDYEAELAAVIGKSARHVSTDEALDHVVGYTILNDTSARDLQLGLQVGGDDLIDWFSGKTMTNTTPAGPYVVVDEIDDPQMLEITSHVNGDTLQDDNTQLMIRSVAELVSFVSSRVELTPGDIIATGTPEGVGTFQDIKLEDGDTVTVDIEGIGTLENIVKATEW